MAKKLAVTALFLLLGTAWFAPVGPVPGFRIGGRESPAPSSWGSTRQIHEVRLEVQASIPYVVTIWMVQVDGDVHVLGSKDSIWVRRLREEPEARLRIEDKTYAVIADPVTGDSSNVISAFFEKYQADYPDIVEGMSALAEAPSTYSVFRLFPAKG